MPRRLPWAGKGTTGRAQVQPKSSIPGTTLRLSIDEDGFSEDTAPATGTRGRRQTSDSDDGLPNLLAEPPTLYACTKSREESSSPPPLAEDLERPRAERMRKGISKFDLRDDEWMMVEDEFLETAKLFTRHLHIAEYERLKEIIEEKKKGAVSRPVIANAKMSATGIMKSKAQSQEQQQAKAIRDVFASQDEKEEEQRIMSPTRVAYNQTTPSSFITKRRPAGIPETKPCTATSSDSDDLDILRRSAKPYLKAIATPSPKINRTPGRSKGVPSPMPTTKDSPSTFAKPALPQPTSKSRSRISRATPFDMLDDWVPSKSQPALKASPERPVGPLVAPRTLATTKPSPSLDSFDSAKQSVHVRSTSFSSDMRGQRKGSEAGGRSEELEERLAKRKTERGKSDRDKKRKTLDADDIPTFLF